MNKLFIISITIFISTLGIFSFYPDSGIVSHTVNPKTQELHFFWKDDKGRVFKNHKNLKEWLDKKGSSLLFAMNGGMYLKNFAPQGLYIEKEKIVSKIDTAKKGYGNFYLQPNGIFYLTNDNEAVVCQTSKFQNQNIKYATQSGPLLLINGKKHPALTEGSKNLHIRNGVGILPNGNVLFAMSKTRINFYDFASFFKSKGCKNALYLDGFVSRTYLPSKSWEQLDGNFGVIIAEIQKK